MERGTERRANGAATPHTETSPRPETEAGAGAGAEADTGTQPGTDTEPSTGTQPDTDTEPSTGTQPDTDTETQTGAGTQPDTDTETQTGAGTQTGVGTETDAGAEPGTGTGPGAERAAGGAEPGTAEPAVRVQNLWKWFGEHAAVSGVELDIPAGRFIGLVGPNGAGKTTTLSMLTGLLRPDSGTVRIVGADVWRDPVAVKSRIGVLPEGLRLFERLSGHELLTYLGALRGIDEEEVERRSGQLLDVLDLSGARNKLVVDYSTGMRKKIGLACALLHNPEVLFLDEPFEGVDPVSAQTIREVLERYTASGATVVFSSHVMELVESLCDWVAVMATGRIRAHGTLDEVRGEAPSLQDAFLELVGAGGRTGGESLDWLGGAR